MIGAFVANPADSVVLAKSKDQTGSNRPLIGSDPTAPTRRTVLGVPPLTTPGVTFGTLWSIPKSRSISVQRTNLELEVGKSAYFTSDRTAIRATMRIGLGFTHSSAMQKISID